MREGSTSPLLLGLCSLLTVGLLSACGGAPSPQGSGTAADNATLTADIAQGKSGAEVTFDAVVATEPADSGGHERFNVTLPDGHLIEVDHNNSLAPEVPVHSGDHLLIRGQLYIDPGPRIGVHCTHAHTSRGCPIAGFIQFAGTVYQ
jgi:hypothetical protein